MREFARNLAGKFEVTVFAPFDRQAIDDSQFEITVVRSKSCLPVTCDPLQASGDLNEVIKQGLVTKFLLCISLLAFFFQACKLSFRADVICSHWLLPSGLIGAVVSRVLNKPHIIVEHSGALHLLRRVPLGGVLTKFVVSNSNRVIVVSKDLQGKLLALCPSAKEKIDVVAMGIDCSNYSRQIAIETIGPTTWTVNFRLLFIGRLIEIKGLEVLLNALITLPDVHLLIAGEGTKRDEFERLAGRLNVNATFFGQVGRVEKLELLAACDAVVIPSIMLADERTEGMPLVALEAMAAGKPLIASRVGGLGEIIQDTKNGLLFEAGNSQALAEKIKLLFIDRKLQQTLSINARQTVELFDWKIISLQFGKIIQDALRTNGSVASYQSTRAENR